MIIVRRLLNNGGSKDLRDINPTQLLPLTISDLVDKGFQKREFVPKMITARCVYAVYSSEGSKKSNQEADDKNGTSNFERH